MLRRPGLGLAVVAGLLLAAQSAASATNVNVSLWDKGDTSMDMMDEAKPMGMAMMGPSAMATMMPMAAMGITVDQTTVPAGEVTFAVTNDSKAIIHEMVLAPVFDRSRALPYSTDDLSADEEAAGSLGEVSELEPGKSGALTVTLTPGDYLLYCNIPGHYILGMWTLITVTP